MPGLRLLGDIREPFTSLARAHENARWAASDLVVAHTPKLGQLMLPLLLSASSRRRLPDPPWRPVLMHTPPDSHSGGRSRGSRSVLAGFHPLTLNTVVPGEVPIIAILRA
ncbi:hypothetical protein [Amycolatopsis sp. H20-H5]|uniref:hypothetical protein n=1 Tax=Amycolatopsis sp. H20-H5 TaxID=3046309 RepID=UPI002DB75C80|nr:hypothetical protein [Amycolatopsis sp. H20-H5]